jgi:hypothetical protein
MIYQINKKDLLNIMDSLLSQLTTDPHRINFVNKETATQVISEKAAAAVNRVHSWVESGTVNEVYKAQYDPTRGIWRPQI